MKILTVVASVCAVLVVVECGVSVEELCTNRAERENYTETVLESLREKLQEKQPFKMEDDIRRVFRLYNGKIFNLHEFTLRHTPQVHCDQTAEVAHMVLLMAFNTTKIHYNWNIAGLQGLSGGFWTFANRITTEVRLWAPLNQNKAVSFKVDKVRLTELDGIWVKVDAVEPLSWIGSQIGTIGTMISRGTLKTFLQNNLQNIFNEAFGSHEL